MFGPYADHRTCGFLGILWQDSAEDNGIGDQVSTVAPFQEQCANIICSNLCSTEDNGDFGTPGSGVSGY